MATSDEDELFAVPKFSAMDQELLKRRAPKILCLHGAGSNSEITAYQIIGLGLNTAAKCDLVNAPHVVDWHYPGVDQFSDGPFRIWSLCDEKDWNEGLDYVAQYVRTKGPFDGVYAFSQGVAVVTQFSHPSVWRDRFGFTKCPWKFVIMACGGASSSMTYMQTSEPIAIPSLHVFGEYDGLISDSKRLARYWKKSLQRTYTHQSGHEIDMKLVQREPKLGILVTDFLKKHHGNFQNNRTC